MRVRVSKLVYLPIGGALGLGLLVSALVAPQQQLVASQDCYGACHSVTTLSLSKATLSYGKEADEDFTVKVRAETAGDGDPTGSVEVKDGSRTLCRADLSHGEGHCKLSDKDLKPGSYDLDAVYSGDSNFKSSMSGKEHLEVSKIGTSADLTLSKSTVTDGSEKDEVFTVKVKADDSADGAPSGSVDVKSGSKTLCRIDLKDGEGDCSLTDKELAPGEYDIQAHYLGDDDFDASTSGTKHLKVDKKR